MSAAERAFDLDVVLVRGELALVGSPAHVVLEQWAETAARLNRFPAVVEFDWGGTGRKTTLDRSCDRIREDSTPATVRRVVVAAWTAGGTAAESWERMCHRHNVQAISAGLLTAARSLPGWLGTDPQP